MKLSYLLTQNGSGGRSEEHTSELQSHHDLVCRLLLEISCVLLILHYFPTRRSSDLTSIVGAISSPRIIATRPCSNSILCSALIRRSRFGSTSNSAAV